MVPMTHKAGDAGNDRPPTMAEIGRALGLSRQAVSKYARQGMPTHSTEAAHAWREANLDPARRKRGAFDGELQTREALARAAGLMALAGQALRFSPDAFAALAPTLRQALRDVPEAGRDRLMFDCAVFDELCRPVRELLDHCRRQDLAEAEASGIPNPEAAPRKLTDEEATDMGSFWYAIAAGERVVSAGPAFRP